MLGPAMFVPGMIDGRPHQKRFRIGDVVRAAFERTNHGDMGQIFSLRVARDASNVTNQSSPVDLRPKQLHVPPPEEAER